MTEHQIIVIGAGMAGLSCAGQLADAGIDVVVLDKGRGVGGRLATRRTSDGWQFDHGAQYVTAKSEGFRSLLNRMQASGSVAQWQDGSDRPHFVGVPGMSAVAKHLTTGLEVRQQVEVIAVEKAASGWDVITSTATYRAAQLVITAPAPQADVLIGMDHPLSPEIARVQIAPCLTLMTTFDTDQPAPYVSKRDSANDLSWIAQNSSKPGRPGPVCWVAQASTAWSLDHLELDRKEITRLMLPMLCERLGADPDTVVHSAAHRWRYARVTEPYGEPYLRDETGTLYLGGDWCLGARIEAAWTSGTAIARSILDVA